MGTSPLGCASCPSKMTLRMPTHFLPSLMAPSDPFVSAEPVFRLPLGHLPWKPAAEAPGRGTPLLAQLWAPGQAPSSWGAISVQGREGRPRASLPSLCTALSAGSAAQPRAPAEGHKRPKARDTQTWGKGGSHIPPSLKIKSNTRRSQLSITPPPKERLRAGNSSGDSMFVTQAGGPSLLPSTQEQSRAQQYTP